MRPDPEELADIHPAEHDFDVCTDPPTVKEVKVAIRSMKNGKAP